MIAPDQPDDRSSKRSKFDDPVVERVEPAFQGSAHMRARRPAAGGEIDDLAYFGEREAQRLRLAHKRESFIGVAVVQPITTGTARRG